jgi:hypothetical protein
MRKIKPECVTAEDRHGIVVLQGMPHQGLVKANRFLLLVATALMIAVFILGFLLLPEEDMLNRLKTKNESSSNVYAIQNPVLSDEINVLKGQLVGLISGSIESKLRALENSVRKGSLTDSLGTIQDLKNDVKVLQTYSAPEKNKADNQANQALLQEVSQLKQLIYLTLTSCGLMFAAIAGFWVRKHYRLAYHKPKKSVVIGRK